MVTPQLETQWWRKSAMTFSHRRGKKEGDQNISSKRFKESNFQYCLKEPWRVLQWASRSSQFLQKCKERPVVSSSLRMKELCYLLLTGFTFREHAFASAWNFLPTLTFFFTFLIFLSYKTDCGWLLLRESLSWSVRHSCSPYASYSLFLTHFETNHIIFS